MKAASLAPLPPMRTKNAGVVSDTLRTLLKGRRYLSPLEKARISHVITPSGFAKSQPYAHRGGAGLTALRTLFGSGPNRMEILKARLMQGGLFGKGGIIHGDIAMDPQMFKYIKKFKAGDRSLSNITDIGLEGLSSGLNYAFTLGAPALTLAAVARGDADKEDLFTEGAATIGTSLGAPFGVLGATALGGLASALVPKKKEEDKKRPDYLPPPEITIPARSLGKSLVRFEAPQPEIYLPYNQQSPII